MKMYLKIHEGPHGRVVAVCDEELIGKVLEGKGVVMDLDRYRNFYIGNRADENEVKNKLKSFDSANIVGKESVNVAISMGLISKNDVMYIKRTPYIQIYRL